MIDIDAESQSGFHSTWSGMYMFLQCTALYATITTDPNDIFGLT